MIYDKTSIKIIEEVYINPGIHKRELSKKLHLGMPSIDYSIKKIGDLLKKAKSGNRINYFLNYANSNITPILSAIEYSRIEKFPTKIKIAVNDFLLELEKKPIMTLIFGSYARGDYTKNSDLDILLVFQKLDDEKYIETTAKKISMRTNTRINPVYLDYKLFKDSFHNSTKAFYKNLKENKIILIGVEWWRQMINEEA